MADENNEDDSWLYGSSSENAENATDPAKSTDQPDGSAEVKDVAQEPAPEDASQDNVNRFGVVSLFAFASMTREKVSMTREKVSITTE